MIALLAFLVAAVAVVVLATLSLLAPRLRDRGRRLGEPPYGGR